jgi:hypothetical protein
MPLGQLIPPVDRRAELVHALAVPAGAGGVLALPALVALLRGERGAARSACATGGGAAVVGLASLRRMGAWPRGTPLGELDRGRDAAVVAVLHQDEPRLPRSGRRLAEGDVLLVLAEDEAAHARRARPRAGAR